MKYAEIILPILGGVYTYSSADEPTVGSVVSVPLGKKSAIGVVRRVFSEKPSFDVKPVGEVLYGGQLVTARQMELWDWLADYYMCTPGEVMRAALPTLLRKGDFVPYKRSQESRVKSQESATRKSLRHMSHQGLITHNSSLMTDKLEGFMDSFDTRFTGFVVPGGDKKISQAHVCRTVCRRAERRAVAAGAGAEVLQYLNRLSDWCFAVSTFFVSFAIRK